MLGTPASLGLAARLAADHQLGGGAKVSSKTAMELKVT